MRILIKTKKRWLRNKIGCQVILNEQKNQKKLEQPTNSHTNVKESHLTDRFGQGCVAEMNDVKCETFLKKKNKLFNRRATVKQSKVCWSSLRNNVEETKKEFLHFLLENDNVEVDRCERRRAKGGKEMREF